MRCSSVSCLALLSFSLDAFGWFQGKLDSGDMVRSSYRSWKQIILFLTVILFSLSACFSNNQTQVLLSIFPDGKDFAFTIIEDPDYGDYKHKVMIYEYLDSLHLKTTKGIWVVDNKHGSSAKRWKSNTRGVTASDKEYLQYNIDLQKRGFEICLHTVGPGNDFREETRYGYDLFQSYFGQYPKINTNHADNMENIYWGADRFSNGVMKFLYGLVIQRFEGHVETSRYFWGDICKEKTTYVRGFATDKLNTLSVNPSMPYHLEDKPYVNYWFGCTDGYNADKFKRVLSDDNIKKLVEERGVSLVYTHFAFGFFDENNHIDEDVKRQLTKISKLNGWFVPASTILDRLILVRNISVNTKKNSISIVNNSGERVTGVTILTNKEKLYCLNISTWIYANNEGEMLLGDLEPYAVIRLNGNEDMEKGNLESHYERWKITWEWLTGRFNK